MNKKELKKLYDELRALRARGEELLAIDVDEMTAEQEEELDRITAKAQKIERRIEQAIELNPDLSNVSLDTDGKDNDDAVKAVVDYDEVADRIFDRMKAEMGDTFRGVGRRIRRDEEWIDMDAPIVSGIKALREGVFDHLVLPLGHFSRPAMKALSEGVDSAGGYIVPVEQGRTLIEMLRARAVVRRAGARVMPMASDTLEIPKQTGGAVAYWVAENAQIPASDQSFGQVTLTAKKLAAMTKMSSELFEDSDPAVEQIVMADLARVLALEEDLKYLRGDGSGNTPTGVANISGVHTMTLGAAPTFDDLADAVYRLNAANAPEEGRAWIMHPREYNTLRKIKQGTNVENAYVWSDPANGEPAQIWGYPVYLTTQIPINLGEGSNRSEIYFGAWGEALIGQRKTLELRASDVAGDAFEYDQVFIRAIMRVDFNVRHEESFVVITDVTT